MRSAKFSRLLQYSLFTCVLISIITALLSISCDSSVNKQQTSGQPEDNQSDVILFTSNHIIKRGDNLASALAILNVDPIQIANFTRTLSEVLDLRAIRPGTIIETTNCDSGCVDVKVIAPQTPFIPRTSWLGDNSYIATIDTLQMDTVITPFEGEIETTLYEAFIASGGTPELAVKYIEIFQFVHYFSSETRTGDRYRMLVEEFFHNGESFGFGQVYAASYTGAFDTLVAVWQPDESSEFGGEFFSRDGLSFRRDLLRAPFPAAKVSSTYGMRRHPVKGDRRMHQGVDFRASTGTPVVASGSGTITRLERNDPGLGNWIEITHGKTGFKTRYGHLKGFAKKMRSGLWVKQGEVIGYVGMTGLATGPHLHYETFRDGTRINPMKVKGSPVKKLNSFQLQEFINTRFTPWETFLTSDYLALDFTQVESLLEGLE